MFQSGARGANGGSMRYIYKSFILKIEVKAWIWFKETWKSVSTKRERIVAAEVPQIHLNHFIKTPFGL